MNTAAARTSAPPPVVFRDAFGERRRIVAPSGTDTLDVLCLRGELTAVPSFEFALRERVSRLAAFRHPYFAQVRTVERLTDTARTLALISNAQAGVRLSDLLTTAAKHDIVLDSDAALCLIRQLVTAVATFHEQAPDAAHGAIGPERVVVTPNARLVIVEYVMGSAIEQLQFSEDRYWRELRVPCPRAAGLPVIDHRADLLQVGLLTLALLLRRCLTGDEFPSRISDSVVSARAMSADGHMEALPAGLRPWLTSALQLDPRFSFTSVTQAREELEKVFEQNDDIGAPSALEAFLARYNDSTERVADSGETQVHSKQPPAPEPSFSERLTQQILPEPTPHEPIATYTSPSLERLSTTDRISAPPVTSESIWSEMGPSDALEALRPESPATPPALEPWAVREPVEVTPVPRAMPSESPSFAARLSNSIEPIDRPNLSQSMLPSHVSFPSHVTHVDEGYEQKESIAMPSKRKSGGSRMAVAAVLFLVLAGGGTMAARKYLLTAPPTTGQVVVTTNPPGAEVVLDGKPQGASPTTLTVTAGPHVLELRGAGEPRKISLDVLAGAQISQYIEMASGARSTGSLQVRSEPAGAKVSVDGVALGTSPVNVVDLTPGEHTVVLEGASGTSKQTVTIEAGVTASLVANLAASQGAVASSGGWISVSTPKSVQLFEDGRLLGSSDSERVMVPAGSHQLDIVNEALGYRATRTVQVAAGKTSTIKIEFPKGTIAVNAVPWADVWIDGDRVGETPIGNLALTLGAHEVIFRNPDLGEKREMVTVTLTAPTRLSVDMRKKP